MNNLDLILENIRLGHINALLLEAKTEDEIVRGVNLINESMQLLASSLLQENLTPGKVIGGGALLGAGLMAGMDNGITPEMIDNVSNPRIADYEENFPKNDKKLSILHRAIENNPDFKQRVIAKYGTDYMNGAAIDGVREHIRQDSENDLNFTKNSLDTVVGAGLGAGAGGLGVLAARRLRR